MLALEQKLVAELTQKTHTPILMHLDILAQRLHNNVGIQKDFAVWAIESWALALDVIQQPSAQQTITPEPTPIRTIVKPAPQIIVSPKPASIVSTSPQQQIGKFIVQDGVATDTETGLIWLRFAHGQRWENGTVVGNAEKVTWDEAMKIPQKFNQKSYGGYNDWRVPTIDELKTLIDMVKGKEGNYIDADAFPKNDLRFWSSSLYDSKYVWNVCFSDGYSYSSVNYYGSNVRLVRQEKSTQPQQPVPQPAPQITPNQDENNGCLGWIIFLGGIIWLFKH
jgi:hypothetical protein